jgi:hypothetical protein
MSADVEYFKSKSGTDEAWNDHPIPATQEYKERRGTLVWLFLNS